MRLLPPRNNAAPKVDNHLRNVVFYCKDCEKVVGVTPVGRKFVYRCNICKTKNVALGTVKSVKNYYHLPDEILALPTEEVAATATTTPAVPAAEAEKAPEQAAK